MKRLFVMLALLGSTTSFADDPVRVTVEQKAAGANVTYAYTVTNSSEQEIVTLLMGLDLDQGDPHLSTNPLGWKFRESKQVGYGWTIAPRGAKAPPGWIALLMLFEERNQVALSWIVKDDKVKGLSPGETLSRFEVTIVRADPSFLHPPFTALFADGSNVSGIVQD